MGMLKHPKNRYNNKNLDNPAKINVKNEMTQEKLKSDNNQPSGKHLKHVTTSVNIRIDNHVRNDISALRQLGVAKSNKALVSELVENRVDQLDPEKAQRFKYLKDILERQDVLTYYAKHVK